MTTKATRTSKPKKPGDKVPFDELKVAWGNYKINHLTHKDAGKRLIRGEFHAEESEIDYDTGLSDQEKVNTILHELGHAIVHTFGIKFKDDDQEEEIVNSMASGYMTVFRDNPALVKWIVDVLFDGEIE